MASLCEIIERRVCERYGRSLIELRCQSRRRKFARPRQVAMYLMRSHTALSLPQIGNRFNGKDHTTVLHACRRIPELMREDPKFAAEVESLRQSLVKATPHEGLAALCIAEALATFDPIIFEDTGAPISPPVQLAAVRDVIVCQRPFSFPIRRPASFGPANASGAVQPQPPQGGPASSFNMNRRIAPRCQTPIENGQKIVVTGQSTNDRAGGTNHGI